MYLIFSISLFTKWKRYLLNSAKKPNFPPLTYSVNDFPSFGLGRGGLKWVLGGCLQYYNPPPPHSFLNKLTLAPFNWSPIADSCPYSVLKMGPPLMRGELPPFSFSFWGEVGDGDLTKFSLVFFNFFLKQIWTFLF